MTSIAHGKEKYCFCKFFSYMCILGHNVNCISDSEEFEKLFWAMQCNKSNPSAEVSRDWVCCLFLCFSSFCGNSQVVKHFIKFLQFLICFLLCLPYHLLWCASFKILRIFGMKTYGNWRQRNEIEWCFSDVVHFCFTCALLFTFSFFFFLPLCPKALSVKNLSIQRQIDSKQRTLKWTGSRTVHV